MKICTACSQSLPREKFSKKQWQAKQIQRRRCKECIAENREVKLETPDNAPLPPLSWRDEDLFKQPPPNEDCPICMLPLPPVESDATYKPCCGKILCWGCEFANESNICPFCRTPAHDSVRDLIERQKKRAEEADDAHALRNLGCRYSRGLGLVQDYSKAIKLFVRSGELGCAAAYYAVGNYYCFGKGVEIDMEKAKHYWELAAMGGCVLARRNLGVFEEKAGNYDRAMKHYMIAAVAGYDKSLEAIRNVFMRRHTTKDDFEKALRAHQAANDEVKSEQREAAAAHLRR